MRTDIQHIETIKSFASKSNTSSVVSVVGYCKQHNITLAVARVGKSYDETSVNIEGRVYLTTGLLPSSKLSFSVERIN